MVSRYASELARVAIGTIVHQTVDEVDGATACFEAIERSSSEALLDILSRYLRTIGTASAAAARHAGRSEANLADVRLGLDAVHAASADALLSFLHSVPEEVLQQNAAEFPVARGRPAVGRPAGVRHATSRPAHVPDFMPPFPDASTYQRTVSENERERDRASAKKKRSRHKRDAQDSLHALEQRMEGDPALRRAAPALADGIRPAGGSQSAAVRELSGSDGRSHAPGTCAAPPDALQPEQAAALQSSAASECSGLRAEGSMHAASDATPGAGSAAAAGPAGSALDGKSSKSEKEKSRTEKILSLQHLHDLDEVLHGDEK